MEDVCTCKFFNFASAGIHTYFHSVGSMVSAHMRMLILGLINTALSAAHVCYVALNGRIAVSNELEDMRKGSVVDYFKVLVLFLVLDLRFSWWKE